MLFLGSIAAKLGLSSVFGGLGSFVGSPTGKIIMAAIAAIVYTVYIMNYGASKARSECRANQYAVEIIELKRQLNGLKALTEDQERQAEITRREMTDLEKQRADLAEKNRNLTGACEFTPDMLDGLRNIK